MSKIKSLFGKDKDIYRGIEKVVTFGNASNENLKHEVSEYVVTERIRDNFEKILDALYSGMTDSSNEIGIWVSGFYGSGKSSFAKYLGFALKKDLVIDGQTFHERLSNRINSAPIAQTFKSIIAKHDPTIILLDCATEQIKGGTLPPILELLIAKVHQLAGYSTDSQLANFERMLENDGNLEKFKTRISADFEKDWDDIKVNDQLRAKGIASNLAAEMYPEIWPDARSFKTTKVDDMSSDKQKVEELLATIRKITGKENIIFIIDEVGQYIAAKNSLILSLQGTLENLKDIGQGKAWLLATAQQTLTEDNPSARLNSDKLYKLNARFPVKAEIEASDIKEICTQRLLGKSNDANTELKKLYKKHGEKLRHYTKLENCDRTMYVKAVLDEKHFVDLYPFLPQHFEVIIALLGRLAKITGGVGLRSAIKVIQDILTDNLNSENQAFAEMEIGKLASMYHIYDVLKSDIRKAYSHVVSAVDKVVDFYGETSEHSKVAKSIGLLQLLEDLYLSPKNVAALILPSVDSDSNEKEVSKIIEDIKSMKNNTLQEIDGELRFMTDAIINIENEKSKYNPGPTDKRKIYEDIIKDIFSPVPSARLHNTKTVKSGINLNLDMRVYKLLETNEEIQLETTFVVENDYPSTLNELTRISTESNNQSRYYLLGKLSKDLEDDVIEIAKCEEISNRRITDDKEINDYLNGQKQLAQNLRNGIRRSTVQAFEKGEIIFRGASTTVKSQGSKLRDAVNSKLKNIAEKVFDKYAQAPLTIPSSDAEKLLKFQDLRLLPNALNHFDIVKSDGSINLKYDAIVSIQEYIDKEEHVEGRKLLEVFDAARYGWSKDTTRFLIALMFIASDIKLRIAGEDIKVKGPKAIEALRNANGFNKIGISRYDKQDRPSMEMLSLSVKRLAELTGESIAPLQDKIAEVVRRHFPAFQTKYSAVKTELENLNLPGVQKAIDVQDGIEEVLKGEGSDAAFRLGKPDSDLYDNLVWIKSVQQAFEKGVKKVFKKAIDLKVSVDNLPDSGIPKELKDATQSHFESVNEVMESDDFVNKIPDLKDAISSIENLISDYCDKLLNSENKNITSEINSVKANSKWNALNAEQQQELNNRLGNLIIKDKQGIDGIKDILNAAYTVSTTMRAVNEQIEDYAKTTPKPNPGTKTRKVNLSALPKQIKSQEDIDTIIDKLTDLKGELKDDETIELNW
ncbi:BREX system P-loop protein BrxC [Gaetbulibacter saemankumensis]|uniref:BREX system P-loop protein BrxC n=1 Tax=Gaetbulibacter saemankumensis TaxID=311208 RepID=UPI0003FCCCA1|nr:BREX system P-loop protein BrxC [Gaetbulibacter saemankumensis]